MTILLIEDNETIAHSIKTYLWTDHINVDIAHTGEQWLLMLRNHTYDLVILDLMLPGIDGMEVCESIRKVRDIPIIISSARSTIQDKSEWFGKGADDYLTKPYDLEELLMRIKAIMKRKNSFEEFVYQDIKINLTTRSISKADAVVNLSIKEFHIIEYLLQHYAMPVSRTALIDHLWWDEWLFDNDGKLDVYISNLRKKLNKHLIITIKGFGYIIDKERVLEDG